ADYWTYLSSTNHPGYPALMGSQLWPSPIGPDNNAVDLAVLQKQAGADDDTSDFLPASAGGGIYAFFSNTRYEIAVANPLALSTIRLELSIGTGATGNDVIDAPSLTLNTLHHGIVNLAATSSNLESVAPVSIPAFGNQPTNINLESYTFDVSSY